MSSIEPLDVINFLKTGETTNELVVDCVTQMGASDNLWRFEDVNALRFVAATLSIGDGPMALTITRLLYAADDPFTGMGDVYNWLKSQLDDWKARNDIPRYGWRKALNNLGALFNCQLTGAQLASAWRKNPTGPQFDIIVELTSDALAVVSEFSEMYQRKLDRVVGHNEVQ